MNDIPNLTDASEFMVGVGVRIVPAGIEGNVVRASLILAPVVADSAAAFCGAKIDIRQWPQRIEAMLQGADAPDSTNLAVVLSPIVAGDLLAQPADPETLTQIHATRAMFYDQPEKGKITDLKKWTERRDADLTKIVEIWERLIAKPTHPDWICIVGALKEKSAETQLASIIPKTTPGSPDIRGVGRGQAALLLSLERGRSLLARANLLLNGTSCIGREEECNLAAPLRNRRKSYLTAAEREANGDEGSETRRKAEETAFKNYENATGDDRLKRELELLDDDINQRRLIAIAAQVKKKESRDKLTGVDTPGAARIDAYRKLLECASSNSVSECFTAAARLDSQPLQSAIGDSVDRHADAVREEDVIGRRDPNRPSDLEADYNARQALLAAQTRLAGLQSQPSLARLFNFVVDIRIPYSAFAAEAQKASAFKERRGINGNARFGFVSAELRCRDAARRVWTTSKVKLEGDACNTDFWPCTRVELDLFATLSDTEEKRKTRDDLIANGALSQVDGVVYIAAARRNGHDEPLEPRFDIISLDAAQAVENRQTVDIGAKPGATPLLTLRTAGLALVDRWRETSALLQALGSLSRDKTPACQVIDADDLTVGYRMDVAVKKNSGLAWRSLCNRWVKFGDGLNHVEPLLDRVIQRPDDRRAFDSAIVVTSAKIQPARTKDDAPSTAYVDDTVGHWTGPPIGVDANSIDIRLTTGTNKHALQLGQCISLGPDPDRPEAIPADVRIPRQVFGGGYHNGLTPRFLGGIMRPLRDGGLYQLNSMGGNALSDSEKYFGVLPCPTAGPRRFLRHERIEAPIVTTPQPILDRVFDGVVDGLRESAEAIVVRSKPVGDGSRTFVPLDRRDGKPISASYRVVVPPSVSAEFADRHGVFDDARELATYVDHNRHKWLGPADGLADIDYDQPAGGFPIYGFSATNRGKLETVADPRTKPSGDAVFRPRSSAGQQSHRRDPYYPDPAAHYIVIAVRDLAGRLIPGVPLIIPVRPTGVYPKIRPIALEVVAMTERSGKPANQERVLGLHSTRQGRYLHGAEAIKKPEAVATVRLDGSDTIGQGNVEASRVRVALEPGESYEIDMWCLPKDDKQLAGWFDVVESAALVASVDKATGRTCISCDEFSLRLRALDLGQLTDFVTRLGLSRAAANSPICGPAQSKVPAGALRCIADVAYRLLMSRPTPELAARRSVVVTHAIAQPFAKPQSQLRLFRQAADSVANAALHDKQAVAIEGSVRVDRPTTGLFEIRAEGASLVTNAFDDDQRRRRTSDEVARGIWPRSPVTDDRMTVSDVYGFIVDSQGCVTLASEQTTLLRVDDDIEAPDSNALDMADRDIAALKKVVEADPKSGNTVRMNAPFTITDSRARILNVWTVAGSRTAGFFRDGKGDILESAVASEASNLQRVVVQATKAPAKVAPITILPAFHLKQLQLRDGTIRKFTVERRIKLRIRMRRPWYSSGEGERLGIVLWPPDILKERIAPSGASVARDYDTERNERADIAMANFSDEDLGPGGDFITRWGLDPTKGSGELGWLVPPTAFADLASAAIDDGTCDPDLSQGPVYVPRASIPIPVDDGDAKRQTSLEASLLTFVPRFDVDHENWFCDVELKVGTAPEPFIRLGLVRYQPFAPAALRVSEPIVEWAQVPQDRLAVVSIDTKNPKLVEVVVSGTGSTHGVRPPNGYDPARVESLTQRPMMKVTMMKRRSDGVCDVARLDSQSAVSRSGYSQRAERVWVPLTQAEWEQRLMLPESPGPVRRQLAVSAENPGGTTTLYWRAEFQLDDKPLDPEVSKTEYSVVIEEVQPMLPATFADEPVETAAPPPSKDRQALAISGPRFAAIVELTTNETSTLSTAPVPAASVLVRLRKRKRATSLRKQPAPAMPTT